MKEFNKSKTYDLEPRTLRYAKNVREYCRLLDKNDSILWSDVNQVIRSSGSIGANYIEANEALSKKDFVMKIKICRKESKETIYWQNLLPGNTSILVGEGTQLMKIFGSILEKSK